jgi:hypothetical protein
MQVLVNTDRNIDGHAALLSQVEADVSTGLDRFSSHIIRSDVFLSDQNSDKKTGSNAMRCLLEVHLSSHQVLVTSHQADSIDSAVGHAVQEMKHSLDTTLGKLAAR